MTDIDFETSESPVTEYLNIRLDFEKRFGHSRLGPGYRYNSYEEMLMAEGTRWTNVVHDVSGPIKNCYENSMLYALDNDLLYCEGYAQGAVIPVLHAWCLNPETGEVIETTWDKPGTDYIGIAFDPYIAHEWTDDVGYYGLIANDWMVECRLLKEGWLDGRMGEVDV